jgi:guanylate kinase
MTSPGKLIVFTAPSGSGKTTIVRHILSSFPNTAFSVSATTRKKRPHEVHSKDYYYLSIETFKSWIEMDAFAEWEEVYANQFYGTLKSEIYRLIECGKHVVFDVDVKGALNIKKLYPESLAVFIRVPSLKVLEERLIGRADEDEASVRKRLAKAAHELTFEKEFDAVLINDDLNVTLKEAEDIVQNFLILS